MIFDDKMAFIAIRYLSFVNKSKFEGVAHFDDSLFNSYANFVDADF